MRKLLIVFAVAALATGAFGLGCAPSQEKAQPSATSQEELAAAYPLSNVQHASSNMKCAACHDEEDPAQGVDAVSSEKCLSCHGSREKVAERTAGIGEGVNPHDNFHYDMQLECTTCHKSHGESVNLCSSCHDADLWMNDIP
ncbi:cytochrome c3 family protein [Arabiibacter massiliensis]|uniref:cytochrome c3 family protein n=1 Tax=Arabiibacter massiliensis TaxID=1870985 RepID=UPI00155A1A45|nr:cytochrome c3 family protein [Arabiibacter massiliensis]